MHVRIRYAATWLCLLVICVTTLFVGRHMVAGDRDSLGIILVIAAEDGNLPAMADAIRRGADIEYRDPFERCTPLISAARAGEYGAVELLLRAGASVDAHAPNAGTALIAAARKGNSQIVRSLLNRGANPNASNDQGQSALWMACWLDETPTDVVRDLLEHGADPNTTTDDGDSAMDVAAHGKKAEKVWLLAQWGAFLPE